MRSLFALTVVNSKVDFSVQQNSPLLTEIHTPPCSWFLPLGIETSKDVDFQRESARGLL